MIVRRAEYPGWLKRDSGQNCPKIPRISYYKSKMAYQSMVRRLKAQGKRECLSSRRLVYRCLVRDKLLRPVVARSGPELFSPRRRSMSMRHRVILSTVIAMFALPVLAAGQALPYPTDAQTGWAVGANKLAAQALKQKLDAGEKVLLIDVRDEPLYKKETIPGAIHIPFASVQDALKDIPKDRTLVFT